MEARELEVLDSSGPAAERKRERPSLGVVLGEWGRLGCIGFGGPPAHMALLRELCVRREGWLTEAGRSSALGDGSADRLWVV